MGLFLDRGVLSPHYIPETLPHRERVIEDLLNRFAPESTAGGPLRVVQLIGPVGSGKTCTALKLGELLEAQARRRGQRLRHFYVNLRQRGESRVKLYRYLAQAVAPESYSQSLGADELLTEVLYALKRQGVALHVTLDEVDYFLKRFRDTALVYNFTRLDEFLQPGDASPVLGVVVIARSTEFHRLLDKGELSTLGRIPVTLEPYSAEEVADILGQRAELAFRSGALAVGVIELIADLTARPPVEGDVRYALDLLLAAGELADAEGAERVEVEHVRRAARSTLPTITTADVHELPRPGQITLLAVARALRIARTPYVPLREIRAMVHLICEELGLKPFEEVEEYLQDLGDRGMVEIKSLTEIGVAGAPVEELDTLLTNLTRRVEESLGG